MMGLTFVLLSIFIMWVSCYLTYVSFKKSKSKILKYVPSGICLFGVLFFGIGPQMFNYVHGITLGLTFLFLGVFFGIAFIVTVITLIYLIITNKNINRIN